MPMVGGLCKRTFEAKGRHKDGGAAHADEMVLFDSASYVGGRIARRTVLKISGRPRLAVGLGVDQKISKGATALNERDTKP